MRIIGVDIDDVVLETAKAILKELGLLHKYDECTTYDITDLGVSVDAVMEALHRVLSHTQDIPIVNGAVEALNRIEFDRIAFISQRYEMYRNVTLKTLTDFNFRLPWDLYFSKHDGNKMKHEIINDLGIELMIEDNPNTLAEIWDNTRASLVVFDRPWNQAIRGARIRRIYNWGELVGGSVR